MTISHPRTAGALLAHVPKLADGVDSCEDPPLAELVFELRRRVGEPGSSPAAFLARVASGLEAVLATDDPDARLLVAYALLDDLPPPARSSLAGALGPLALELLEALEDGELEDPELEDPELEDPELEG